MYPEFTELANIKKTIVAAIFFESYYICKSFEPI